MRETRDRQTEDAELLSRLQAGDESALKELAETYSSKIYQLAFRYLRNKEDAEEITQDVLYKVHRNGGTFRGDAALSSWIYRIMFNAALTRVRTATYQRLQEDERHARRVDETSATAAPREPADWSGMGDEGVL